MSIKQRLEKSAKTLSRFSGLLGDAIKLLLPFANANVYFHVTDGTSFTLEIRDMGATLAEGKIEPITLELSGSEENFLAMLQGNISFATAWVNDKIRVKGVRNNLMNALIVGMIVGGLG